MCSSAKVAKTAAERKQPQSSQFDFTPDIGMMTAMYASPANSSRFLTRLTQAG